MIVQRHAHQPRPATRLALAAFAAFASACGVEKNSMLAPSNAQISLTPDVEFVARNTAVGFTAQVRTSTGEPVADGTEVVFAATLGTVDQLKVRTRAGIAAATFTAGGQAGTGGISASSGSLEANVDFVVNWPVGRVVLATDPLELPPGGGQVTISAAVVSSDGDPLASIPVTFETSAGTLGSTAAIVTDAEGRARTTLQTSTAATVRARALTVQSEAVPVVVRTPVVLTLSAVPATPKVGDQVTVTVNIQAGGQAASGTLILSFGDGRIVEAGTVTGSAQLTHAYSTAGGYNVTATVTSPEGSTVRETVRVEVSATPPPAPTPEPPPSPSPSPSPSPTPSPSPDPAPNTPSGEPIDLSRVVWLHTNVSNWRVTSAITNVSISSSQICISHTRAGRWPVRDNVEGNPWVFVNQGGTWYAATYEWLKSGQVCKGITASNIGGHIKKAPLENWRPRSGELVGFMISALARQGQGSVAERSQVVMMRWP